MKNIKSYKDFNEEINWKTGIAGAALGASLLTNPMISKSQDVNRIERSIDQSKIIDAKLDNILNEIYSNIKSEDSAKYIELFNKLSNHLSSKYGVVISKQDIQKIDKNKASKMSIFEILGWLGSICLAVCGLPQAWMSFKDKHSEGMSWAFILLWAFGEAFALTYVYDKLDAPLLLNYLTNILVVGIILYYKINPKNQIDQLPDEISEEI